MKDNYISVIGQGFVGLTLSIVLCESGFKVIGIEKNKKILDKLKNGEPHFFEPNLDKLLKKNLKNNNIIFKDTLPQKKYYAHIITVGTPLNSKNKPNFNYIDSALNHINQIYSGDELVVLRSTVSIGISRYHVAEKLKNILEKKKIRRDVKLAFCPERTIEGDALNELRTLPQIISGLNSESLVEAKKLFNKFCKEIITLDSLESGELAKLFCNTYRDIFFSIGNVFNDIAQSYNINGLKLIEYVNKNYSRSKIPFPGFVGGPCLEKDAYILTNSYFKKINKKSEDYILTSRKYNEGLIDDICDWYKKNNFFNLKKIVISGIAFKGKPSTSDLRGSPAIPIIKFFQKNNVQVVLHDFCVKKSDLDENLSNLNFYSNLYDAVENKSSLLILNNHSSYNKVTQKLFNLMKKNPIIFDVWSSLLKINKLGKENYFHIGNYKIIK